MAEISVPHVFHLAMQHLAAGNLVEAESLFQRIVTAQPAHASAWHMLGMTHRRAGDNEKAIVCLNRALSIDPACPDASYNLGNLLRDMGHIDAAIAAYRQSIALRQNIRQSYHNLACVLRDAGRADEAAAALEQKILVDDAREKKVAAPARGLHFYDLGNTLKDQKRFTEAIVAYRQAIAMDPDLAEAHCNLGNALLEENQTDSSIAAYRQAIGLNPNLPQTFFNLGKALYDQGQLDDAIAAARQAIALRPNYFAAYRNLANSLFESGQLPEAIRTYGQAMIGDRDSDASTGSDLIYTLHFDPRQSPASIGREIADWNARYAERFAETIQPHHNDRDPDRRLRIGYVSPDFRNHVVGHNLLPLFREHDHQRFEIISYSNVGRPDRLTEWFAARSDQWRDIAALSDEQLAEQIRRDRIDVLVDLALHTRENRLLCFARKPAPVQATFAGYPGSTGLHAIDYRISDPYLDPAGADESYYSEKTVRLPHSFWCYDPGDAGDISVSPLPSLASGNITFGCLNNFCKINSAVLDLWARVMREVTHSRLLLLAKFGSHRQRTIDYLQEQGIGPDRVEFVPYLPRRDYLRQYHRIDIGLDTFPYNGHTTSLDSFWMGVPVITLVGQTPVARAGWCQLSNLDLVELAARDEQDFVAAAVQLAGDLSKLQQLRDSLRDRMKRSPLMDAPAFASGIEAVYRTMWKTWVKTG
jgi:predicted O-linked N-acetylglucosamine transferase (SPINDLY family)